MSARLTRKEAASLLLTSVIENRKAEWWKEEACRGRYSLEETERALGFLFEVFDDDWVRRTLDVWAEKGGPSHTMIQMSVPRGSLPLVFLVELGKDIAELRDLDKFDVLARELRNPSKFKAACLESQIAAHCLRNKYLVELYPRVRGKVPDLRISMDSGVVFAEIMEMDPGEAMTKYYETADLLSSLVLPDVPKGVAVAVTTNVLPNSSECMPLARAICECLHSQLRRRFLVVKPGRLNALISLKEEAYPSFSLIPPAALAPIQLKRLSRRIKHEARQIPPPSPGFVILDAGVLYGFPDELVRDVAIKTFEKYRLPNIAMAVIVRSYRFHRPEAETEVIGIPNPYCTDYELLTKLDRILAFSRFRAPEKKKRGESIPSPEA
jgi:hypothetical protein